MPLLPTAIEPDVATQRRIVNQKLEVRNADKETGNPIAQLKGADEIESAFFADLYAMQVRQARMGVEPATVLNLNPFPLEVNSPLFHGLVVPACPVDQPYTYLLITESRYDIKNRPEGMTPVFHEPFFLAMEFEQQSSDTGGVLVVRGNVAEDPTLLEAPAVKARLAEVRSRALDYCKRLKGEADAEWHTPSKGARSINEAHRNAAKTLLYHRLLSEAPAWVEVTRDEASIAEPCFSCKVEPRKGAVVCASCGEILNPRQAFLNRSIDEKHHALARLSRKELNELHISKAYQPETFDERAARLKKEFAAEQKGE